MRALFPRFASVLAALALAGAPCRAQVFFTFDYRFDTEGYFSGENAYRRSTLEAAGATLAAHLAGQSLDAVDIPNSLFLADTTGTSFVEITDLSVAENEIMIFVGAAPLGGPAGIGGPGVAVAADHSQEGYELLAQRGTGGETILAGMISFNSSPIGGSLYWDSDTSDFEDPDPGSSDSDAYTVALHELLHVLGIGTSNRWHALVDPTPREFILNPNIPPQFGVVQAKTFIGEASMAVFGGPVPLQSDATHLYPSSTLTMSIAQDGTRQSPVSFPYLMSDQRGRFTELDLALLRDIGWAAHFPPAAAWTYDTWIGQALVGTSWQGTAEAEPSSDPDGDGLPNLLEYALDRDPTRSDSAGAVATEMAGDLPALVFLLRKDVSDLLYQPEVSRDLTEWSSDETRVLIEPVAVVDEQSDLVRAVEIPAPSATSDQPRFIRLRVSLRP